VTRYPQMSARFRLLILLSLVVPAVAVARPAPDADSGPQLVAPADGARVAASVARFEARLPRGEDGWIVISRTPFDPAGWTELPTGTAWTIVPAGPVSPRFDALNLPAPDDLPLWWAGITRSRLDGTLASTEVRQVTIVPRFANRAAPPATVPQATTGRISRESSPTLAMADRPAIELSAGYRLLPGRELPSLPRDLLSPASTASTSIEGSRGYIVQFADGDAEQAMNRIRQSGGHVAAPLDDQAWLVRLDSASRRRLEAEDGTPWITAWEPAYKLSPDVDRRSPGAIAMTGLLFEDAEGDAAVSALRDLGATNLELHQNGINKVLRFEIDRAQVDGAARLPEIAWLEPAPRDSTLNRNAQWIVQTGTPESRRVWDMGLRGQGQRVMIADSGLRPNHEMFDDPAVPITDYGLYPDHRKIVAYRRGSDHPNIVFGDDDVYSYHGSHTAGTLAGNNDPTSTSPDDGMAPEARLDVSDLGGDAGGIFAPADLNDLFLPSWENGARISSNSWGSPSNGAYTVAAMQLDQFMWNHPDYLVLFANGNNGVPNSTSTPASAKNCLSVGGTGNGDLYNTIYLYSSRGPTQDFRRKPTICAPGDIVGSSFGSTRYAYVYLSGTSMATPATAGAVTLMRQYLVDGWYPTGTPVAAHGFSPSAALLKAMTINSGRNNVQGGRVPDNNIGWGRVSVDDVLYFPGDAKHLRLIDAESGILDGQFVEFPVEVTDASLSLDVALCWTDPPGHPAAARQLINDLDLEVTNGDVTYAGNRMFNGASLPSPGRDSINVEECVRITVPTAGSWTVRVKGQRVMIGPQPFALCITGGVNTGTGTVALDRFEYALADTVAIEVIDADLTEATSVTVSSTTEPAGETLTLAGEQGVYRGIVPISPASSGPGDGLLTVSSGDVITVTYSDDSPAGTIATTARINVDAPVISDVHARTLTANSALINWKTDRPATSRVHFGADGAAWTSVDVSGFASDHSVILTGLTPGREYAYDVESMTRMGGATRDSLGGRHRHFTGQATAQIALVMGTLTPKLLNAWTNSLDELGWDIDVIAGDAALSPLVGNSGAGLRRYAAVLWQVDPDAYPPLNDDQRAAIDSLLAGGGRLLICGHDLAFGLSDASSPGYTEEREFWLERTLATRYAADQFDYNGKLFGTAGDPISGEYAEGFPYDEVRTYATDDKVEVAPGIDGTATRNWLDNGPQQGYCGLRWESSGGRGQPGAGFWGGDSSRLLAMYFEWAGLGANRSAPHAGRTDVLKKSVTWLLGRRPPEIAILNPAPGHVIEADSLNIRYIARPDDGPAIRYVVIDGSFDDGESWARLDSLSTPGDAWVWRLDGSNGGPPVPNSTRVRLRMTAADDGAPSLHNTVLMSGSFTIARPDGDWTGPTIVAGTLRTDPMPVRNDRPATLSARFSDDASGGGLIIGAEYMTGPSPAAPGAGTPMLMAMTGGATVATAEFPTSTLEPGRLLVWARGRDAAGNWGPAERLELFVNGEGMDAPTNPGFTNFLAPGSPNPFHGSTTIRFGLESPGTIRLELFDTHGRLVRRLAQGDLPAGNHETTWDGRNDQGETVAAGVFHARLVTPAGIYKTRLVALH